jgi:hypothetical protein
LGANDRAACLVVNGGAVEGDGTTSPQAVDHVAVVQYGIQTDIDTAVRAGYVVRTRICRAVRNIDSILGHD